jgi:hypothetical protein
VVEYGRHPLCSLAQPLQQQSLSTPPVATLEYAIRGHRFYGFQNLLRYLPPVILPFCARASLSLSGEQSEK